MGNGTQAIDSTWSETLYRCSFSAASNPRKLGWQHSMLSYTFTGVIHNLFSSLRSIMNRDHWTTTSKTLPPGITRTRKLPAPTPEVNKIVTERQRVVVDGSVQWEIRWIGVNLDLQAFVLPLPASLASSEIVVMIRETRLGVPEEYAVHCLLRSGFTSSF